MGMMRTWRGVDHGDGLADEARVAHQPVERILHHAGNTMGIFRAGDEQGIGPCNRLAEGVDDRAGFVIKIRIEQRQRPEPGENLDTEIRRRKQGSGFAECAVDRLLPQAANKGENSHAVGMPSWSVNIVGSRGLSGVDGIVPAREATDLDIPRIFNISESAHRIHNPLTAEKLATLGAALRLAPGTRILDLGSGSGEMLCTWARDYGIVGTGIDKSPLFTEQARERARELGVADRLAFLHDDAAGFVADEKAGVAACIGATWIGGGVAGTVALLRQSLVTGGILLIGEPYWRQLPPTEAVAKACLAGAISDFQLLPDLISQFGALGYDLIEMVLADQDSWDRYEAAKWLTMRRWLDDHPDDAFGAEVRAKLDAEPLRYVTYSRNYLGWGVFALMVRPEPVPGIQRR